jgi:hypothetical protein
MKTLENNTELSDQVIALATFLGVDAEEITEEGNDLYSYGSHEYLVVDDSTADQLWEDDLDNYLENCVYPKLPANLVQYFDHEKWKCDARFDGRANSLSRYDGNEDEESVNGETYYIYRQN